MHRPHASICVHTCIHYITPHITTPQAVAKPEWLHRMSLDGLPTELAARYSWDVLHMLYRHLCGVPIAASRSTFKRPETWSWDQGCVLAYQPFLADQLDDIGMHESARGAVKLLWLVHAALPSACEDMNAQSSGSRLLHEYFVSRCVCIYMCVLCLQIDVCAHVHEGIRGAAACACGASVGV
jgi:hypothetical protein